MAKIEYAWVKSTLGQLYGSEVVEFVLDNLLKMGLLKTDRLNMGLPEKPKKVSDGVVTEFESNPRMAELLIELGVKQSSQKAWLQAYQDTSWLAQEFFKAIAWIEANQTRKPKNFSAFFTNWLSKGWERHRKTLPTVAVAQVDWDKVL